MTHVGTTRPSGRNNREGTKSSIDDGDFRSTEIGVHLSTNTSTQGHDHLRVTVLRSVRSPPVPGRRWASGSLESGSSVRIRINRSLPGSRSLDERGERGSDLGPQEVLNRQRVEILARQIEAYPHRTLPITMGLWN